jgi:solute carrier family 25 carnitine/acylcarnitine transporter 20/29
MQCGVQIKGVANDFNMSSVKQLYRGVLPPLVTAGVMQSVNFAMYEHFKELSLGFLTGPGVPAMGGASAITHFSARSDSEKGYLKAVFMGGVISGAISTCVSAPVGLIKVRQQLATRAGVIDCTRQIYRTGGLSKFYRAFPVIFVADSFGRGVYLGTYETSKSVLPRLKSYFVASNAKDSHVELVESNDKNSMAVRMASAATAGCVSWFVAYPLDVVKSRMQLDISGEK